MKSLKFALFYGLITSSFAAVKPERNLEDFGFSPDVENFRQKVSLDFKPIVANTQTSGDVPNPVMPNLSSNYSDLVPPPTKPKSRRYFQPKEKDGVPASREEYVKDREQRIRDYKRPPGFNSFLQNHANLPPTIFGDTEIGLTGLHRTITAEILPKGTQRFSSGISHTSYNRSFGNETNRGSLRRYVVPMGVTSTIADNFEAALHGNVVNEKSVGFPLLNDFEKTEFEELNLLGKYQFVHHPGHNLKSAFGFGVQQAMGRQVTRRGSDGTSYMAFVSTSKGYEKATLHGSLGFSLAAGVNSSGNEQPNSLLYNIGFDLPWQEKTSFIVEMNGLDWSGYGNNIDLAFGARYRMREEFNLEFFFPVNILDASFPYDYDYVMHAGLSIKI